MADVFRISVVLAIVYLARFISAYEEDNEFYSADFQRGDSSTAIEDSNENIPILSKEYFRGGTPHQRVWSEEDDRDVELNEKVLIQSDDPFRGSERAWSEEKEITESNEDNLPDELDLIHSGVNFRKRTAWSKEDKYAESNEYNPFNENVLIKSGFPLRGSAIHQRAWSEEEKIVESKKDNPSNNKVHMKSGARGKTINQTAWSEDKIVESKEDNPSNEKVLIESGIPLRKRIDWLEEDKIVESNQYNPSKEKVLIQSGVPLRGRTIHQTAWSEEEKIVESKEEATQEHVEKNIYDAWSLSKAFNYILSFIYDVEDDGAIVQTPVEDTKKLLKSQNGDFREIVLPQSQNFVDRQKKTSGNLSSYNQDKDSFRGSTTSSPSAYFQDQDTEWFEREGGEFDNGNEYFDFEFVESLFEVKDYDQEDDFSNQFGEGGRTGTLQENPRKNTDSNLFEVKEKEMKVQGTGNEAEVANKPAHSLEKPAAEVQSKVKVITSIDSNQKSKRDSADIFAQTGDKKSNKHFFKQVENQNGKVLPVAKESPEQKLTENEKETNNETTESIGELESYINYAIPVNSDEIEFPLDKQKERNFHTASNGIKNKFQDTAYPDVQSSVTSMATSSVPSTESTHQNHSQMRKENIFIKTETPHPYTTQKYFQHVSSTLVLKNLNRHKKQAFNFNHEVKNNKIKSPIIGSNQESNHEVNAKQTTAQMKNEALKIPPNGARDIVEIAENLRSKQNKENKVAQFQKVKSPTKPTKENGAEHSKPKTKALRDLYPDFEVQENVASYNYMLDSDEFIRVDGTGQNKVNKKQNNSTSIPVKNDKHDASKKITPFLSEPSVPLNDQSKPEIFETILEYIYNFSNSTLLLSLREYNSSES